MLRMRIAYWCCSMLLHGLDQETAHISAKCKVTVEEDKVADPQCRIDNAV
jgi:hypothetical protein